jgi:AcrR family transcriptional regulator
MSNGHARRRRAKTAAIKAAATELFSRSGTEAVSMEDIAAGAGVSKMTLYNYFGSKEALVFEVFREVFDRAHAEAEAIVADRDDFVEVIRDIIRLKGAAAATFGGEVVLEAMQQSSALYEYVYQDLAARTNALLVSFFDRGRRAGYIRADVSNEMLLAYFDIFNAGLAARVNQLGAVLADPDQFSALVQLFFFGLVSRDGPGHRVTT